MWEQENLVCGLMNKSLVSPFLYHFPRQYEKMASVMKTFLGIAPVLFLGRGLLQVLCSHALMLSCSLASVLPCSHAVQESFGLLPQRRPLRVVVGAAIPVEIMEAPTEGQIDSLHKEVS